MKRYATVNVPAGHTRTDYSRTVSAYLPSNYRVRGTEISEPEYLVIEGEDNAGWTLDGYVIPRLWSGLIAATEISGPPG